MTELPDPEEVARLIARAASFKSSSPASTEIVAKMEALLRQYASLRVVDEVKASSPGSMFKTVPVVFLSLEPGTKLYAFGEPK